MAPPPEGIKSPKGPGKDGSTGNAGHYNKTQDVISPFSNRGKQNAGAGQKADQKGGQISDGNQGTSKYFSDKSSISTTNKMESKTLHLNQKYGTSDNNQLDIIVENESQYASTHGVLAAIEKHATEGISNKYANKRHSE